MIAVLTHEEELKAGVAQMVDACDDCSRDHLCERCQNNIGELQDIADEDPAGDFDVTDYLNDEQRESLEKSGEHSG